MPQLDPETLVNKVRAAQCIQLEIPDDSSAAKYWTPHQFTPFTTMARVKEVALTNELPGIPVDSVPSTPDLTIVLTERVGEKRNNRVDIYRASLQGSEGLVVRIMDLTFYPPARRNWFAHAFADDFHAYNTVLAPLQGTVVPRFGGMFARGLLYCMIHEDAGRLLTNQEKWDRPVRNEILAAIAATHEAGIATNPTDWNGICRGYDGRIKLTDFRWANTLRTFSPEYRKAFQASLEGDDGDDDEYDDFDDFDDDDEEWTPERSMTAACEGAMQNTLHLLGRSGESYP